MDVETGVVMTDRQEEVLGAEHESVEELEIDLLLEAVYRRWGYDFRSYARASIERRIRRFLSMSGGDTVAGMIPMVLRDDVYFSQMVRSISVTVTEFFRDP